MSKFKQIFCFLAAVSVFDAHAASITYDFSGSINRVSESLASDFSVNDTFSGSFTVDGTDDSQRLHRGIINGTIMLGGLVYQFNDFDLFLRDQIAFDQYIVENRTNNSGTISGPMLDGRNASSLQLLFEEGRDTRPAPADAVFGLTSNQPLVISLFDTAELFFSFGGSSLGGIINSTALATAATPLPAAAWLFMLGVGGIFARNRMVKSASQS